MSSYCLVVLIDQLTSHKSQHINKDPTFAKSYDLLSCWFTVYRECVVFLFKWQCTLKLPYPHCCYPRKVFPCHRNKAGAGIGSPNQDIYYHRLLQTSKRQCLKINRGKI